MKMINHPNRSQPRDGRGKMKFEYQDVAGKLHKSAKAAIAANRELLLKSQGKDKPK